jgi:nitroreductase
MLAQLRTRRSIRRYTDAPLANEVVEQLQEAVLRSPSSRGRNPWRIIFVEDRSLLARLARCKPHGAAFLRRAALGIVVCGDESRSDVWIEDCAIVSTVAHLTAHSLGLGSCWIQVRLRGHEDGRSAEEHIRQVLGLPRELRVLSIVAVGHPAQELDGHERGSLGWDRVERRAYSS